MKITNTETLGRRSTLDRRADPSPGHVRYAANQDREDRNDSAHGPQRGRRDRWSEGGNHLEGVHVLPNEEDRGGEEALREEISRRRSNGETLVQLAKHFHYSKGRISRILAQQRLKQVEELGLDYIPNEHFSHVSAAEERLILGPAPENRLAAKKVPRPVGLPPYLASMYETPLLTREQEQHLFRKMNYLKHKASELRKRLDGRRRSMTAMELILKYAKDADSIKNDIVRANLRLVVSIAKRYAGGPAHLSN